MIIFNLENRFVRPVLQMQQWSLTHCDKGITQYEQVIDSKAHNSPNINPHSPSLVNC